MLALTGFLACDESAVEAVERALTSRTEAPLTIRLEGAESLRASLGLDPWGNPWIFEVTGKRSFRIRSLGADGRPGGSCADADLSSDDR